MNESEFMCLDEETIGFTSSQQLCSIKETPMADDENKILMMVDKVLDINFAQLKQVEVFIIPSKQESPQLRRKEMVEI